MPLSIAAPAADAGKAEQELALQAQDDIAEGLMWIHGYLSGREAASGRPVPPLTRSWLSIIARRAAVKPSAGRSFTIVIPEPFFPVRRTSAGRV